MPVRFGAFLEANALPGNGACFVPEEKRLIWQSRACFFRRNNRIICLPPRRKTGPGFPPPNAAALLYQ